MREHFGERLHAEQPEAWRAGHERLYEHYKQAADELPATLEAMLPLNAAVVHGCRTGQLQEAADEVYWRRINRGSEFFSIPPGASTDREPPEQRPLVGPIRDSPTPRRAA